MFNGFSNSNIYVEGKGIIKTSLKVDDGKIVSFENEEGLTLDESLIVVPGFIDKHIHGANNSDSMYPTLDDIRNIAVTVAKEGVSSFLPTTMTQSEENIKKALANINEYMKIQKEGAKVLGIHLEGPFISKKFKGAQPEEYVVPCDVDKFIEYNEVSGSNIMQVTLAVEENGEELIKYLVKNNIVASIGHTNATSDEVLYAGSLGANSMTHTYNGMKPLHHREAGSVGGALLCDDIYCEVICDLVHVSDNAIKLLYRMKGHDKFVLITDGIESKHLSDGKYKLGGQDVYVKNGEARLIDGTLAGSTLKMNVALKNVSDVLGLTVDKAVDLCTINPARCLHIADRKGSINLGKDADFAVIDKDFNVYMTVSNGQVIYKKGE